MFMIFINEVIKKWLFIQFKCRDLEFVVGNLWSIPGRGSSPPQGARVLHDDPACR